MVFSLFRISLFIWSLFEKKFTFRVFSILGFFRRQFGVAAVFAVKRDDFVASPVASFY
jgi:hypothetical protein